MNNVAGYFFVRRRESGEGGSGVWRDGSCFRSSLPWETAVLGGDVSPRDDEGKGNYV